MGHKLHVGNIPSRTTEEELRLMFSQFGVAESTIVIRDTLTGASKGYALVEMSTDAEALKAIARLNFTQNEGLIMGVSKAR